MRLTTEEKHKIRTLVMPFIDDLHRVAISLTRNNDNAEELVSDTILNACEGFRGLRDHSKVKQWLLRILSNKFISNTRRRKNYIKISLDEHHDNNFSLFEKLSVPFLLWHHNPEQEVIRKILDEDISCAISDLPEQFRIIVILCDVEGMEYKEIAETLDIPIGTVRSRLARGRNILQKQLWHHAREAGIVKS
jgi:RNA polymerase sigma-70 factor (ECF subfamily)